MTNGVTTRSCCCHYLLAWKRVATTRRGTVHCVCRCIVGGGRWRWIKISMLLLVGVGRLESLQTHFYLMNLEKICLQSIAMHNAVAILDAMIPMNPQWNGASLSIDTALSQIVSYRVSRRFGSVAESSGEFRAIGHFVLRCSNSIQTSQNRVNVRRSWNNLTSTFWIFFCAPNLHGTGNL